MYLLSTFEVEIMGLSLSEFAQFVRSIPADQLIIALVSIICLIYGLKFAKLLISAFFAGIIFILAWELLKKLLATQ